MMPDAITPKIAAVPASPQQKDDFRRVQAGGTLLAAALPGFTPAGLWSNYQHPPYLVRDMLGPGELTVLFGMSGHFKSVIAVDLAMCVGCGIDFHGVKAKRTGVLYVAGEGHNGLRKRARAWMIANGIGETSDQPSVFFTTKGTQLMAGGDQLTETAAQASKDLSCDIGLIILDTWSANYGKGSMNDAAEASIAIASARNALPGAAVMAVHHSGHADPERERDSSVLPNAADYRMRAVYDKSTQLIELEARKVKDNELWQPMFFNWQRVGLGWTDDEGEELTSVVLKRSEDAAIPSVSTAGLGENQEAVIKALRSIYRSRRRALEERGDDPNAATVVLDGLRKHVEKRVPYKRFYDAIKSLQERGLIVVEAPHVRLADEVKS